MDEGGFSFSGKGSLTGNGVKLTSCAKVVRMMIPMTQVIMIAAPAIMIVTLTSVIPTNVR